MVKGDNHSAIRNMAFAPSYCHQQGKLKPHLLVPHWIGTNPIPFNNHTKVIGNIADLSNGGVSRLATTCWDVVWMCVGIIWEAFWPISSP